MIIDEGYLWKGEDDGAKEMVKGRDGGDAIGEEDRWKEGKRGEKRKWTFIKIKKYLTLKDTWRIVKMKLFFDKLIIFEINK